MAFVAFKNMRSLTLFLAFVSLVAVAAEPSQIARSIDGGDTFEVTNQQVEQVNVVARRSGTSFDRQSATNTLNVNQGELRKAACCTLGESFETNASVDVSYSDAATGARTIQLLGLHGRYVQMLTENVPNLRGVAASYGLSHVPGTWMDGIQISKGVGLVVGGYEAFTGQINVDYKKPTSTERASGNVFASTSGRIEANAVTNIDVGQRLKTAVLLSAAKDLRTMDCNDDGFCDEPRVNFISAMNRWHYSSPNYTWMLVGKYTGERRVGGSVDYDSKKSQNDVYGIDVETNRLEMWMKNGIIFGRPRTSLGIITSYIWHRQSSIYGHRTYDGAQHSYFFNAIFQTGTDGHELTAGLSSQGDFYRENVTIDADFVTHFDDVAAGIYAQYTLTIPQLFTLVAGLRADVSNQFSAFLTPRLHARFTPTSSTTLRFVAGQGRRTAALFAENNSLLASSRQWHFDDVFCQEKGWNFGLSAVQYVTISNRLLTLSAEYYRTQFGSQMLANMDRSARLLVFDVVGGSYSNIFQIDAKYQIIKGLELTAAYRLNDAQQILDGQKRSRPLAGKYKALVTASYATPLGKWQFDFNTQLSGPARLPTTSDNPAPYQLRTNSVSYLIYNAQITKNFRHWSLYAGAENLGNYTQPSPIIAPDDPFGQHFDATLVWGPLASRRFYVGLRLQIDKQ